ncbi:hypothetical protein [Acinetobacter sp. ESBL14]
MADVIHGVDIPSLKIKGTHSEVATQIFKEIISPNTEMLFKKADTGE